MVYLRGLIPIIRRQLRRCVIFLLLASVLGAFLRYSLDIRYSNSLSETYGPFSRDVASTNSNNAPFSTQDRPNSYLHLIVPATSSNQHLCRLLLSVTALGYPTPVFVNWGHEEDENPYRQHLDKIPGILRYLSGLEPKHENDLALIVDGFDVWFQLRPEVLIRRYYQVIISANIRLAERFGSRLVRERKVYNSILFGPDKNCWPADESQPACWAVPDSTLPKYVFGPDTDSGRRKAYNRPRWLNSGTIMGPIADLRRLFNVTASRIKAANTSILSDQYHLANIFGEQELSRSLQLGEHLPPRRRRIRKQQRVPHEKPRYKNIKLEIPALELEDGEIEQHITIDYESRLFQTISFYFRYLGWVKYDHSTRLGQIDDQFRAYNPLYFDLPHDVSISPGPFFTPNGSGEVSLAKDVSELHTEFAIPFNVSWENLTLGTNIATREVFSLIHFTPPKELRFRWWTRMWYFPYGAAIMRSGSNISKGPYDSTPDGRVWSNYEVDPMEEVKTEHRTGGAFADSGAWLSWRKLCDSHEAAVFTGSAEDNAINVG